MNDDNDDIVQIRSLEKYFGEGKNRVSVLDDVSLDIRKGSLFTFLGPSGCGKTTTLRCVAGLEKPEKGTIKIGGDVVFSSQDRINVPTNRRPIGMVFQSYAVWPHMTVFENVAFPLMVRHRPWQEIKKKVTEVLEIVGLQGLEERPAPKLSGGQQQRVAFARALVNEPRVMLLDEPLSNLDAKLRELMRFEIKALQRRLNITTIFVTHDQSEALAISDRIAVMSAGKIVEVGAPESLYSKPKTRFTATFLGQTNMSEGRVLASLTQTAQPTRIETKSGTLSFTPTTALKSNQKASISIRPEHIQIMAEKPDEPENVLEGTVKEVVFMGDSYHCQVAVGDWILLVKTQVFTGRGLGERVFLHLNPHFCTCFPADEKEFIE
ncbi:MAG: ABC transporter ATP-binding protein [Rhodospirillales bacterium]